MSFIDVKIGTLIFIKDNIRFLIDNEINKLNSIELTINSSIVILGLIHRYNETFIRCYVPNKSTFIIFSPNNLNWIIGD